ncbi:MAG: AarF/ABC1/UbiB kinase family protein [Pseudomonadota bacterium]
MEKQSQPARPLAVPSRRITRFGRISGMTAGVAGNMALNGLAQLAQGKRPKTRDLLLTPGNINRVADQLAKMRGAAMKIGQLVSMDTGDVLPPELAQIMARLREDAHTMPAPQLKKVLGSQWPDGWLRQFKSFDVRPIAAASIGQVHRAMLKDGRDLAIKVQYPGVAQSIDSDVANVGVLIRMSGLVPKGIELAPYLEEARLQLHQETDYAREGSFMQRFGALVSDDPRFAVPEMIPEWSTGEILAMTYLAGQPIEAAEALPQETRNKIAHDLIDLTLAELFTFGVMQTDPNFANYRYDPQTGRIILLDFGATSVIDAQTIDHYRRLMRAGMARDAEAMHAAVTDIGFIGPETKPGYQEQIVAMMDIVFEAVTRTRAYDFTDMTLSNRMQASGMALAEDGFTPPLLPIDVLLVQRKFGGVFLLANRLGATVDVLGILNNRLSGPSYQAEATAAE